MNAILQQRLVIIRSPRKFLPSEQGKTQQLFFYTGLLPPKVQNRQSKDLSYRSALSRL